MARPWIAILGELVEGERVEVRLSQRYAEAIERAGGIPIVLPYPAESAESDGVEARLERCDGLLISGGDDFDTERLGLGPTHPRAKPVPARKQDHDLALVRHALAVELPVLGICYGMQLLALAEGARLFQHLPDDRPGGAPHSGGVRHAVALREGTKLRAIAGVPSCEVISRHHQAIAAPGPRWRVAGEDPEGLIEAVERAEGGLALGVQWHPELSNAPHERRLFQALVDAARSRAESRWTAGAPR